MSPTSSFAALLLAGTSLAAAPLQESEYERFGMSARDAEKAGEHVAEYFGALLDDRREDMRDARQELVEALEKAAKRGRAEDDLLTYTGELELAFEYSKPENRDLSREAGKGFFQHVFEGFDGNTGVLLSLPKAYRDADVEFLPVVIALKDPVGGDGDDVVDALSDRAEQVYGDLMESHIIMFPLGNMEDDGRRAEVIEQTEGWMTEQGLRVLFTSIRVLSEQLRHDRSEVVLDGWGTSGEDALRVASVAPGLFAGIVNRGGTLGGDDLVAHNLNYAPFCYVMTDDAAAEADAVEALTDDVTVIEDAGALHEPSDDAVEAVNEWIAARDRPLAPDVVDYKLNDLRFQSANWVKALKINRRSTAKPSDPDYPSIHAEIEGNTIDITTVNVEQLYLFLSDDLVDLGEEVTINVNGEERVKETFDRDLDFALENRFYNNSGDFGVYTASVEIDDIDPNVPE